MFYCKLVTISYFLKYCSYNNPEIKYFKSYIHYLQRSRQSDSTTGIHHAFTLSTSREDKYYGLFLWLCIMPYRLCAPMHLFRIICFFSSHLISPNSISGLYLLSGRGRQIFPFLYRRMGRHFNWNTLISIFLNKTVYQYLMNQISEL